MRALAITCLLLLIAVCCGADHQAADAGPIPLMPWEMTPPATGEVVQVVGRGFHAQIGPDVVRCNPDGELPVYLCTSHALDLMYLSTHDELPGHWDWESSLFSHNHMSTWREDWITHQVLGTGMVFLYRKADIDECFDAMADLRAQFPQASTETLARMLGHGVPKCCYAALRQMR